MSKKEAFKSALVEKDNGYETTGQRDSKRQVNGAENKKAKFANPRTVKMSKDERRLGYFRSKGFKADLIAPDNGAKPSKNKFKG